MCILFQYYRIRIAKHINNHFEHEIMKCHEMVSI